MPVRSSEGDRDRHLFGRLLAPPWLRHDDVKVGLKRHAQLGQQGRAHREPFGVNEALYGQLLIAVVGDPLSPPLAEITRDRKAGEID